MPEYLVMWGQRVPVPGGEPGCLPNSETGAPPNWEDGKKALQAVADPFIAVGQYVVDDLTRTPQERWDDYVASITQYGSLAPIFGTLNGDPLASVPFGNTTLRNAWEQALSSAGSLSSLFNDLFCDDPYARLRALSTIGRDLLLYKAGSAVYARANNWVMRNTLLAELRRAGIKHSPSDVLRIARMPDGQIIFLEKGRGTGPRPSGLQHVLVEHAADFARRGISAEQIPDLLLEARAQNRVVGYQGRGSGRPIYRVEFNGQTHYVAISIGSNGYIVGANPAPPP